MSNIAVSVRAAFLTERKRGIGGSDIASLFNAGYGCRLRLWRDKRDETPDFPRPDNEAMELGRFLEPFFAKKYSDKTGRNVIVRPDPTIHPQYPELRVNVDRMIDDPEDPGRDVGVLEIKSVGRDVFYKIKREGLPEDYILQLQHGMLVTESEWGSFAIGSRDSGELLQWDVPKDEVLAGLIITEGQAFWQEVQSGLMPDRLEPDDRRCQTCEYRRSCQGAALMETEFRDQRERDETLRPLLTEHLERVALADQAEELVNETKEELKTKIGGRTELEVAGHTIYFRPQTSLRGDFKALSEDYTRLRNWALSIAREHPELGPQDHTLQDEYPVADRHRKPSDTRPLRIY